MVAMFSADSALGLAGSVILALAVGALTGLVNGIGVVKFRIPAMINSKIGKFFIRDTEEITNEQVPKQEFYYFVASKDGIQKKNFKEETGEELTSKNVFFKEISASEQPKIEIKVKELIGKTSNDV